jgi:hypothetical protein
MKSKVFLLFLFLTITNLALAQKQIRNASWGWSKDSVKRSETLKLISDTKDGLMYSGTLGNQKFSISYKFIKNKLTQVFYIYSEKHVNKNNYISTYEDLKGVLSKKYDVPITDEIIWKDDLYKDNENDWGMACRAGHVTFKTRWENSETDITLICAGENFDITLGIIYTSKYFLTLITKEKDEQNEKDF